MRAWQTTSDGSPAATEPDVAGENAASGPPDWAMAMHEKVDLESFAKALMARRPNAFWLDGGPGGISRFGFGTIVSGADALDRVDAEIMFYAGEFEPGVSTVPGYMAWEPSGYILDSSDERTDEHSAHEAITFIRADRIVSVHNRTGAVEVAVLPSFDERPLEHWREFISEIIQRPTNPASEPQGDDIKAFLTLRSSSQIDHAALIRIGGTSVITAGPESQGKFAPGTFGYIGMDGSVDIALAISSAVIGVDDSTTPRNITPEWQ